MNGLMNLIKDNFSAFVEVMLYIPSRFQIWYVSEVVILVFILSLALGVIFLCARLIKKYNLGFAASVLLTFLVLSLTLGLTGFFLSIPQLFRSVSDTFLVVGIGSPVFNLGLSVVASLGNRLRNNYPIAGTLLFCGVGLLFAYVLFTTFTLFALRLYN
jgi:predicted MFS family arabinose efflux permease